MTFTVSHIRYTIKHQDKMAFDKIQTNKQVIIMNAFTVKTAKNELSITQNSNNWPILVGSKGETQNRGI